MDILTYDGDSNGLWNFLCSHPGITHLRLEGLRITSLKGLEFCHSLQYLDASGCASIDSVTGLHGLKNLFYANLSGTKIEKLNLLENCTGLQILDLSNTPVTSIFGLQGLKQLQFVSLENTNVNDLRFLVYCPSLKELHLTNTPVAADLSSYSFLSNVKVTRTYRERAFLQSIASAYGSDHPPISNMSAFAVMAHLEKSAQNPPTLALPSSPYTPPSEPEFEPLITSPQTTSQWICVFLAVLLIVGLIVALFVFRI